MDAPFIADPSPAPQFRDPPLTGRHAYLRPVVPEDYGALRLAETSGELAIRWRFRGSTPAPEQWAQASWNSVLAQFIVARPDDHRPAGLVVAYQPNFQDQYAYFAAASFQSRVRSPVMILGTAIFLQYVFTCWSFRKLYLEVPEYNLTQVRSGVGRLFAVEGRLREHIFYDGRFWDQVIVAIYRETWERRAARLLSIEAPPHDAALRIRMPRRA